RERRVPPLPTPPQPERPVPRAQLGHGRGPQAVLRKARTRRARGDPCTLRRAVLPPPPTSALRLPDPALVAWRCHRLHPRGGRVVREARARGPRAGPQAPPHGPPLPRLHGTLPGVAGEVRAQRPADLRPRPASTDTAAPRGGHHHDEQYRRTLVDSP